MSINIYDALRRHFPEKEYALMSEVRDSAGFSASRSADYMAMNLWPSRGLGLHGIEKKASRSDWLNELKKPEKADVIFKYCDFWWLFTTNVGVAKIEEIPSQWGWIQLINGKIKVMKDAPKLTPCVMDRSFLACILKRAVSKDGFISTDSISDKVLEAKESGRRESKYELDRIQKQLQEVNENVRIFQEHTGIDLQAKRWMQPNIEKISEAVNFIATGGSEKLKSDLLKLEQTSEILLKSIQKGLLTLKQTELKL